MICVVVLPSMLMVLRGVGLNVITCRGDSQERRYYFSTLVLPSVKLFVERWFYNYYSDVGEIHRVDVMLILRSPLSEPVEFSCFTDQFQMSGRLHRRVNISTLVLPSMKPES